MKRRSFSSQIRRLVMRFYWRLMVDRYYYEDGCPKQCYLCKSYSITQINKEHINGIVAEHADVCGDCRQELGYWAYGCYNPNYRDNPYV